VSKDDEMRRWALLWILVWATLLALVFAASVTCTHATTYYVDCENGDDANAGTSESAAWLTVGKVNSTVSGTSDDVYFDAATECTDAGLVVDWSGTTGDHVIIGSYGSAPVSGTNDPEDPRPPDQESFALSGVTSNAVITIAASTTYVDIDSVQVACPNPSADTGIKIANSGVTDITVTGAFITNCDTAIYIDQVDGYTIEDSYLNSCGSDCLVVSGSNGASNQAENGSVVGNLIDCGSASGYGILFQGDSGTYTGNTHDFTGNVVRNCVTGGAAYIETEGTTLTFTENTFRDNANGLELRRASGVDIDKHISDGEGDGTGGSAAFRVVALSAHSQKVGSVDITNSLLFGMDDAAAFYVYGPVGDLDVWNNTIGFTVDDASGVPNGNGGIKFDTGEGSPSPSVDFRNNVFVTASGITEPDYYIYNWPSGGLLDYNSYWRDDDNMETATRWHNGTYKTYSAFNTAESTNSNSFITDPELVNVLSENFWPDHGSLLRDAATATPCPSDDHDGNTRSTCDIGAFEHYGASPIACTEAALHTEIARLNACGADLSTWGCERWNRRVTFDCSSTTIKLRDDDSADRGCSNGTWFCVCGGTPAGLNYCASDSDCVNSDCMYNDHTCHAGGLHGQAATEPSPGYCSGNYRSTRVVEVDHVIFDGESNGITFELDPRCSARVGVSNATEFEQGAPFMQFDADFGGVKNLSLDYFWQGVEAVGSDVDGLVVDNVDFTHACDDYVRGWSGTGTGNVVSNSDFADGLDKCIQISATQQQATNWLIDTNTFRCSQPVKLDHGNVTFRDNVFGDGVTRDNGCSAANDSESYWEGNTFDYARWGLRIQGAASATLNGNTFSDNTVTGLMVCDTATVDAECNTFSNNGGSSPLDTGSCASGMDGGVSISSTGTVDLGGGSLTSAGQNVFYLNSPYDVENLTGVSVKAEENCWSATSGNCDDATPDVSGTVDTTPVESSFPSACATITVPSTESACADGLDNDEDGLIDCADSDCDTVGDCEQPEATCDDGIDNDGDSKTDCTDGDCTGDSACAVQTFEPWQQQVGRANADGMFSTFCLLSPCFRLTTCNDGNSMSLAERERWAGRYCDVVDMGGRGATDGIKASWLADANTYNPTITGTHHGQPESLGIKRRYHYQAAGVCTGDTSIPCDKYTAVGRAACTGNGSCNYNYWWPQYEGHNSEYIRDKNDMPVISYFTQYPESDCNYESMGCCSGGSRAGLGCGTEINQCPGGSCGACTRTDDQGTSRTFSYNSAKQNCDFLTDPSESARLWWADWVADGMVRNQDDGLWWNNHRSNHFFLTDNTPANLDRPAVSSGSSYMPFGNKWQCDVDGSSCTKDEDCSSGACDNNHHRTTGWYYDTDGDGDVDRRMKLTEARRMWAEYFHYTAEAAHSKLGPYVASVGTIGYPNYTGGNQVASYAETAMMYLAGSTWCSSTDQLCATNNPSGWQTTLALNATCPGVETCSREFIGGDGFMQEHGMPICGATETGSNAQDALDAWWDLLHLDGEKYNLALSCLGNGWNYMTEATRMAMGAWHLMLWESKNYTLFSGGWMHLPYEAICHHCTGSGSPYPSCTGSQAGDKNCNDDGDCCLYDAYPYLKLHIGCPITVGASTKYVDTSGLMTREFEGGFVALNLSTSTKNFTLPGRCSDDWTTKCTVDGDCGGTCETNRWRTFGNSGPLSASQSLVSGDAEIFYDDNVTYSCDPEGFAPGGDDDLMVITEVDGLRRSDVETTAAAAAPD
jgi:parallel beta-helix repeat protein